MKIHYSFHVFLLTFIAVIAVQEWENMKLLNESGLRGAFNPHVQPQTYCNYLGFPFFQSLIECQPAKNLCFFKVLAPGIRTRPEKSLSFHSGLDWCSVSKSAKLLKPGTRNSWRSPSSEMLMKHPRKLKPQCIATEEAAPNDPKRPQPGPAVHRPGLRCSQAWMVPSVSSVLSLAPCRNGPSVQGKLSLSNLVWQRDCVEDWLALTQEV